MEDSDDVLEKGREELTLDRPPAITQSSTNLPLIFTNDNKQFSYLKLDSPRSCLTEETNDVAAELFDPLSCSEHNQEIESNIEDKDPTSIREGLENEIVLENDATIVDFDSEKHSAVPNSSMSHVASSADFQSEYPVVNKKPYLGGIKSRFPNSSKQPLVSCFRSADKSKNQESKSKSVHYPDNECVLEYIEPVDPWRDVRTPSNGEVISFYRNTCQKLRCKPIHKVITQIQEIPDLSTRAGTLVLRGTRLDVKSCEALESVFRRVQFENLDVENCSLEEDGATALLEMIEFYNSTCKLNIACNPKIGIRGWQTLCRMLRKTHVLSYLDARRTLLTDMTMPTFGRCLKADPFIKILHLEGVFLSGRPLLILTTAMKYNKVLEELYLGDNDLTSSDGPPIGAMLTYNTTLQLLDLRNNQMKDIGLAHIGNGLADQSEQPVGGLCSLIMWKNGLTHEGMSYLCEGLIRTSSLKALNLGQNRLTDLGLQKLKIGLLKNKSLRKLGLLNTKMGCEGAVALAEVLADSLSITRIDIRENSIQTAGLMAFSMALKVNQSLLRLDLDKDIKKEPGMESVMQTVLVDIYNLCHRNKQLARQTLSSSTSSISIESISSPLQIVETVTDALPGDDVFHPETSQEEVIPFSPADNLSDPIVFPEKFSEVTIDAVKKEPLLNSAAPVFDTQRRLRSLSDPVSMKDPEPSRRSNRFSVTQIIDSITSGMTNKLSGHVDQKFKKQTLKNIDGELPKAEELLPVLEHQQHGKEIGDALNPLSSSANSNVEVINNAVPSLTVTDEDVNNTKEVLTNKNQKQSGCIRTSSAPDRLTRIKNVDDVDADIGAVSATKATIEGSNARPNLSGADSVYDDSNQTSRLTGANDNDDVSIEKLNVNGVLETAVIENNVNVVSSSFSDKPEIRHTNSNKSDIDAIETRHANEVTEKEKGLGKDIVNNVTDGSTGSQENKSSVLIPEPSVKSSDTSCSSSLINQPIIVDLST